MLKFWEKKMEENKPEYKSFKITATNMQTYINRTLNVYLMYDIEMQEDLVTLLNDINGMTENDTIMIHINNFGGSITATSQIVHALKSTPAKVVTIIEGVACSAASFIFLLGDEKIVTPYSTLMLHYYSGVSSGKGQEIEAVTEYDKKHFRKFMVDFYKKLLTKKEFDELFSGKDFYFDSEEIMKRLPDVQLAKWNR